MESVLGDDVSIMTKLSKLLDAMPSSQINVKLIDRPLTPVDSESTSSRFFSSLTKI
jgi:hypothetical protein